MSLEPALPTALAFARRGHAVFPLHWPVEHNGQTACSCGRLCGKRAAKHPVERYAPNGCLSATTDTGIVKLWFGLRVPEANLGLHCDGLIVIDVDPRDGGDESFKKLEAEHGEMPLTWQSITGSGGQHIFFRCPDGVEVSNVVAKQMTDPPLGVGIDVRTRGGYVVCPPSRHFCGGMYCWSVDHHPAEVKEIAPAPDWLIEKLTKARASTGKGHNPEYWADLAAAKYTEYGDDPLRRIAGKLLRAYSLPPAFVLVLLHAWNAQHCDPPLPEDKVEEMFERICKHQDDREEAEHAS